MSLPGSVAGLMRQRSATLLSKMMRSAALALKESGVVVLRPVKGRPLLPLGGLLAVTQKVMFGSPGTRSMMPSTGV